MIKSHHTDAPGARLSRFAAQVASLRLAPSERSTALQAVKQCQVRRLAKTYADLLLSPRYGKAAQFFLDDLYGDKDFSQRDAELQKVIPTLQRFLPDAALDTIALAVELDAISENLDSQMANECSQGDLQLPLSRERYQLAYQRIEQTASGQRERQMELVELIGLKLNGLVRAPLLGGLLKSMGPIAVSAGLSSMHEFLSRGFAAFKHMGDAREFLRVIAEREKAIHDALCSSSPFESQTIAPALRVFES